MRGSDHTGHAEPRGVANLYCWPRLNLARHRVAIKPLAAVAKEFLWMACGQGSTEAQRRPTTGSVRNRAGHGPTRKRDSNLPGRSAERPVQHRRAQLAAPDDRLRASPARIVVVLPVLQATAAALLFGLSAPLAKILVGASSPWLLAGLLYLGAGGFRPAMRPGRRGRPNLGAALRASDRWWLAGVVLAGGILAPPLLLWGLARAPAASIALLLNTEVIFTALIAAALFREHVGARILAATGLVALGGMAVEWSGSGPAISPAAVATLVACALWGLDNNLTRRIAEADPFVLVQVKGLAAGTTNLILASLVGSPQPRLSTVALGLALGA